MRQGFTPHDGPCNGRRRSHIADRHAHVEGQPAQRDLPLQNRHDELFFTSLGIFGFEHRNFDIGALRGILQDLDRFGFVVFDSDNDIPGAGGTPRQNRTGNDGLGTFQHDAIIRCEVWLTLTTVDQDRVHRFVIVGRVFYVRRKGRPTEAHDPRVGDGFRNGGAVILPQTVQRPFTAENFRHQRRAFQLLAIGLDGDHLHMPTVGQSGHCGFQHFPGYGGMQGCGDKPAAFAYHIAKGHYVLGFDHRNAGRSHVLQHGQQHLLGAGDYFDGKIFGKMFPLRWMDSVFKGSTASEGLDGCCHKVSLQPPGSIQKPAPFPATKIESPHV